MQADLAISMQQFKRRWKYTTDNVNLAEKIEETNGKFFTLDARPYVKWLDEFNIFYRMRVINP